MNNPVYKGEVNMKHHSFINVFKVFAETQTCFRCCRGKGKAVPLQAWT